MKRRLRKKLKRGEFGSPSEHTIYVPRAYEDYPYQQELIVVAGFDEHNRPMFKRGANNAVYRVKEQA